MKTANPETLLHEISYKSSVVVEMLARVNSAAKTYRRLIRLSLLYYRYGRMILSMLDTLERQECAGCGTNCFSGIIPILENMIKAGYGLIDIQKQFKFFTFAIWVESGIINEIENKLENYWISSDVEIKETAASLHSKINQAHAIR